MKALNAEADFSGSLFDAEEIGRYVPHRSTMRLLDSIAAFEMGRSCTSVRYIRPEEPFLDGHYPGRPIVPGIYLMENIAQTACFLLERSSPGLPGNPVLARVERCTFKSIVQPGCELVTRVVLERAFGALAQVRGTCTVKGRVVCEANLVVGRSVAQEQEQLGG